MPHMRTVLALGMLAGIALFGCGDDEGAGGSDYMLCSGSNCVNSADCPEDEPTDGDDCTFSGNCHYCPTGENMANGYTCDGSTFSAQGTFTCQ